MNDRVKEIRKSFGLTLEKFGERLGVTKTTISRIENGINNLTEQMLKAICREFNVNEDWLRTGEGEMYKESDNNISQLIDEIMQGENEFYKKIFKTFVRLDKSELLALEKILDKYVEISTSTNQISNKKKTIPDEKTLDNLSTEELEEEYKKSVLKNASSTELSVSSSTANTKRISTEKNKASNQ